MRIVYSIMFIFTMMLCLSENVWAEALSGTAVLVEGTVSGEGLPCFATNRISAITGKYKATGGATVQVWGVTEPLLFNPAIWTAKLSGKDQVWYAVSADKRQVWCIVRTLPMREELISKSKWTFMISVDSDVSEGVSLRFLDAFVSRTEFFFSSVKRIQDLSFPATVAIPGN